MHACDRQTDSQSYNSQDSTSIAMARAVKSESFRHTIHLFIKHSRVYVQTFWISLQHIDLQFGIERVDSATSNTQPVSRQQLEVLVSVKEITGALVVKYINDSDVTDLSFLRHLQVIKGHMLEWVLCSVHKFC